MDVAGQGGDPQAVSGGLGLDGGICPSSVMEAALHSAILRRESGRKRTIAIARRS